MTKAEQVPLAPLFEHHEFARGVAVAGGGAGEVGDGVVEEDPVGDGEVEELRARRVRASEEEDFEPPGEGEVEVGGAGSCQRAGDGERGALWGGRAWAYSTAALARC